MKLPTASSLYHLLLTLNWNGHMELGENDLRWLANEIHALLAGHKRGTCEVCGAPKNVVITTALGLVCEDCIEEMSDAAASIREDMEARS